MSTVTYYSKTQLDVSYFGGCNHHVHAEKFKLKE